MAVAVDPMLAVSSMNAGVDAELVHPCRVVLVGGAIGPAAPARSGQAGDEQPAGAVSLLGGVAPLGAIETDGLIESTWLT